MTDTTPGCGSTTDARKRLAAQEKASTPDDRDARKAAETIRVTVTVDTDELRAWAEKHADAGHHGVAHVLFKAASDGESLSEQHDRQVAAKALREAAHDLLNTPWPTRADGAVAGGLEARAARIEGGGEDA